MRCPKCDTHGTLFSETHQRRTYECKHCGHMFSEPIPRRFVSPEVRRIRNEIRHRIVR